jgi:hypothetical protein
MKFFLILMLISCLSLHSVVINEFLAANQTILADEWGEFDDWLELYNNSTSLIDLSGYYLSDRPDSLDMWQFPAGISIGSQEYLIVWLDGDDLTQGPLHTNFRLNADGESIIISDPDLNVVDSYTFGPQSIDISMGRSPNGVGGFIYMVPTPGYSNDKPLVINEFMASNESTISDEWGEYDDWLELYNSSNSSIDLSGFYLSDNLEIPEKWQFPNGVSIGAGSYLLIWLDGDDIAQGPLHTNFRLSADGESIILSDGSLNLIDSYTFGLQITDISMGRFPNGIGSFQFMMPSPLAPNFPGMDNDPILIIEDFYLSNFPNPFNPTTVITFRSEPNKQYEISIYNLLGQKVKTLPVSPSQNSAVSVMWDGTDLFNQPLSSGVYFYKLIADGKDVATQKCLLLK